MADSRIPRSCAICGAPMLLYPSQIKRDQRYCSSACYGVSISTRGAIDRSIPCARCGLVFQPKAYSRLKHCSWQCRFLAIQDTFEGVSGCWKWPLCRGPRDYGVFDRNGTDSRLVHRIAWELNRGPIPEGLFVLHDCDNPPCFRADHLFLGTHQDNMDDMVAKGRYNRDPDRWPRMESHGNAKLTVTAVHHIRSCDLSEKALAKIYGVSKSAVNQARHGDTWKSC